MPFDLADFPEAFLPPPRRTILSAWHYHLPLAPIFVKLLRPRTFVELGTHAGDSYIAFCKAFQTLGIQAQCTAIDTWQGDEHTGQYGPEILKDLRAAHDPQFGNFSRLLQSRFDDAAPSFSNGSIDLLHIDGAHTYDAVKHDFETWLPKLSDRGVALFHDTAERKADFGVWKLFEEISVNRPSANLPHDHGLGILAIGPNVPPPFLEFLSDLKQKPQLPQILGSLGRCVILLDQLDYAVQGLRQSQNLANEWRTRVQQPVRNPTNTLYDGTRSCQMLSAALIQDVHQMVVDALNVATELSKKNQQH